nr:phosphatase and tensin [Hymenolepis microstoma]
MWYFKNQNSTLATSAMMQPGNASSGANFLSSSSISSNHFSSMRTAQQPQHLTLPQQQHPPAKMVYRLKSLVSKKKKRFQADGFDLDLSYISPRIIAMGFPAERIEGLYRNHIDEVSRFFELRHKGHYKIYHLCNERDFNEYRFSGPVVRYPFSDHNAPQFEQILALCHDVMQFLNAHPENVVAINCKAGKGRTGVMVCACLLELQEARNAEEALRLYAEKRTRNGQGVTIPSQRRYVQYYSRLLSSGLTYEPTPLRLTSIRIEGVPHQLHGVQNFELSISTYQNRLSMNSHINHHDSAVVAVSSEDPVHCSQPALVSSCAVPSCSVSTFTTGTQLDPTVAAADNDCHRYSDVATYQIPCSTHHSDNGSYLIRLDEPVTVFEDFRIKIKAKTGGGVLTKKIGQCWLNTFFVLLDDDVNENPSTGIGGSTTSGDIGSVGHANSTGECCSTSDSNSGSGSSSDSSGSSSASSSVRNSPPHFVDREEDHELYEEDFGVSCAHHQNNLDDSIDEEGDEEDDEDELPTLTSNSVTLNYASPQNPTSTPQHASELLRGGSNPPRFVGGGSSKTTAAGFMPFISIPEKDSYNNTVPIPAVPGTNFIKKNSPNASIVLAPSLSTQLATPLAVRLLELSQSDLDAAVKGKGKKGEEFKLLFEFIRETPCGSSTASVNSSNPTVDITTSNTTSSSCCLSNQKPIPMDLGCVGSGSGVDELSATESVTGAEQRIVVISSLSTQTHHQHHHHPHSPFRSPTESTPNQTGALVL